VLRIAWLWRLSGERTCADDGPDSLPSSKPRLRWAIASTDTNANVSAGSHTNVWADGGDNTESNTYAHSGTNAWADGGGNTDAHSDTNVGADGNADTETNTDADYHANA